MNEEIIISGRATPNIDPVLSIWHWPIPLYLFLGGLAAGLLFFSALYYIRGKKDEYATAVKIAPIIAPIAIAIGLAALVYDLTHKIFFWQLLTTFRIESPMSWGAWTLTAIMPLSMMWVLSFVKEWKPEWTWKYAIVDKIEVLSIKYRTLLAWSLLVLAIILGVYTGILLSAFNARPLWNTSLLGPLFLVSGLSTGAACILLMSKNHAEKKLFSQIDILLIAVELFFIIHLFMGFMASSQVQIDAAQLFLGGEFTTAFWLFVVVLGLITPAVLETMELRGYKINVMIPAILVLLGGIAFRFIMVEAGQITRYLY